MNLVVNNFQKHYPNHTVKLPNITSQEKITLIIGANGSGKTTLLKAIASLYRYTGKIHCEHSLMYTDETVTFPPHMTINHYLELLINLSPDASVDMKETLLELFNLTAYKTMKFKHLSKGMEQKVNLIQVLMENKELYILDEPLSGLDRESQMHFINHLRHSGKHYIIATHKVEAYQNLQTEHIYL